MQLAGHFTQRPECGKVVLGQAKFIIMITFYTRVSEEFVEISVVSSANASVGILDSGVRTCFHHLCIIFRSLVISHA